jgi:imidazole glycerol-phosphate synthase subunit HisF
MAYKRIIGVLTVQESRLVKSYGYASWRPAGRLVSALRNLDRWAVDEIVVLDISRRAGFDPAILQQITAARVSTPLAYGGGIRSVADVRALMDIGCDRFVLESMLFADPAGVQAIAAVTGRQALIGSLPLKLDGGIVSLWRPSGYEPLAAWRDTLLASPVSEFFITSVPSEGYAGAFPPALIETLDWLPEASVLAFGGLNFALGQHVLTHPRTAAVAFGNRNHEIELALPRFRQTAPIGETQTTLRTIRLP